MTWRLDWDSLNNRDWRSAIDLPACWAFTKRIALARWNPTIALALACLLGAEMSAAVLDAERRDVARRIETRVAAETAVAVQRAQAAQPIQAVQATGQDLDARHAAELDALKQQIASATARLAAADAKLAEANKRLADLEVYQTPRKLTYDQRRGLIAALVPFRGQKLTITSVLGNKESRDYRDDFVQVFEASGWDLGGEKGIQESAYDIDPVGIEVTVHQINEHEGLSNDAINALIKVLRQLDLFETGGPKMSPVVPAGQFEFRIGHKAHKTASR